MRIASALSTLAAVAALSGGAEAASVYSKIVDADCTVLKTYEDGGAEKVIEIQLSGSEQKAFDKSVAAVAGLIDACKKIAPKLA